jgi:hypothetical protein
MNASMDLSEAPLLPRRHVLKSFGMGLGGIALADLMSREAGAATVRESGDRSSHGLPHFTPKAKRVIYLFMSGGPSQLDLFDYKPLLVKRHGEQLPDSVRGGQRLTGMSGNQSSIPMVGSPFAFAQHGPSGAWISELLPHTASVAGELCILKSMFTESINHGPGVTFIQTGSQVPGRPSMGAWLNYGLGCENANLPGFVVLITKGKGGQPLGAHLWGNGFLPSDHQGIQFRPSKDPVLYLNNPEGVSVESRRLMLDRFGELHRHRLESVAEPQIEARIANYEMAFRMQSSIPDATAFGEETEATFALYGEDSKTPGTFAANCLQARRLAERGVRLIQLYHQDWDHHGGLPGSIPKLCRETDRACAALILDLKQRGMLDETLIVWGGEFGRTNYCQGKLSQNFGRDHHPRCFTAWMAGGGVKGGMVYGETDEFGYNLVENGVHIHDLQATILHLMGLDHEALTYKFQGRRYRLTDVHGKVVKAILQGA